MIKLYDPKQIGSMVHVVLARIQERQILLSKEEIATVVELFAEDFDKIVERMDKVETKYERKEDAYPEMDLEMQKIIDELIEISIKIHSNDSNGIEN